MKIKKYHLGDYMTRRVTRRGTTRLGALGRQTSSIKPEATPQVSEADPEEAVVSPRQDNVMPDSDSEDSEDDVPITVLSEGLALTTLPESETQAGKAMKRKASIQESVSSEDEQIGCSPKRRKLPSEAFQSDGDDPPPSRTRSKVRRRDDDSSAERVCRRNLARDASSSEGEETGELPIVALDPDDDSPIPKRIHRRNSDVDKTPAEEERADSDVDTLRSAESNNDLQAGDDHVSTADSADVDDLELSPPPTPSKPTPKELKTASINRLKDARENKSSPTSIRRVKAEETDGEEPLAWESDTDKSDTSADSESGSEGGSDSPSEPDSFINDEDVTSETAADVQDALGPEHYARRDLSEHFPVFVEFLVRSHLKPEFVNKLCDEEKWPYEAAIEAVRKRADSAAELFLVSTWSTPFRITLRDRPTLIGPYSCNREDCQACWTRGNRACNDEGCFTIWTLKGFYNRDTFEDKLETDVKYGTGTTRNFENSAQAEALYYQPQFRLVVGARCAQKAVK
ncbi:hypothetical protein B0H12DRAFT_834005 [Mycena haematopus]|nr:hypothetical protein B0H12DRAFT_834005 [Mycena haematopus]